jgi:MFS family permease
LSGSYPALLVAGFLVGGLVNPLYALLIAYTNDYLRPEDMAGASGGLLFINCLGAILGPLMLGVAMEQVGPRGYFATIAVLLFALAAYAAWRATRRASISSEDTARYAPVLPTATPVAVEAAQEVYAEAEDASGRTAA